MSPNIGQERKRCVEMLLPLRWWGIGLVRIAMGVKTVHATDGTTLHASIPPARDRLDNANVLFGMLFDAFPDFGAGVDHLIAEDDMVALHMTWTGTHEGEFMGIPASGRNMSIEVIDIFRIVDGRFLEHWGLTDIMSMMQQLGAMPE